MYYSNIQNKELAYFHNRPVHNFTVKLSQILTSPIFKVEEIITDSIYKIYPLFYTNEITSSNSNDKILENKVIICQKTDEETYLTFKSNDGEVIDFSDYGTYYNIGDSLTMAQFNAYISLLRQNVNHNEEIHIKDNVTGEYGTYLFDIEDTTLTDSGMIVSDETIQAEPKVKLSDWVFTASKYILKLQILHYTGANILDDNTTDFKVVDTLEIELQRGKWVNIPVESIEKDYIISLNAEIIIDHSAPIIQDYPTLIDLTVDKSIIQTDETADLIATVTDDVKGLNGIPVYFYEAYEPTLLKLTGDKSIMQTGDVLDLKATLKDEDGSLIEGEPVYFYEQYEIDAYFELVEEQTQTFNDGQNVTVLSPVLSRSEIGNSWKLSFDLKATVEGRIFIGSSSYAVPTNPQYSIFMGRDTSNIISYGVRTTSTNVSSSSISSTEYQHCTIEFNNGTITYYVDNNVIGTKSVDFYENYDEYVIGLVAWTNGGGAFNVKNIILEDLE